MSDYLQKRKYLDEIKERVRKILQRDPRARDSDKWLMIDYLVDYHHAKVEYGEVKIKVEEMLRVDYLTVLRRRQEIQAESDMLPSSKVIQEKRGKEELVKTLTEWESA